MNQKHSFIVALVCGSFLVGSCSTVSNSSVLKNAVVSQVKQVHTYRTLGTVECPSGGIVVAKPGAPIQQFDSVNKLPTGNAIKLDFKASQGTIPEADKIWYKDDVPFALEVKSGATFEVLDSDATDGKASVQFPEGVYDSYVALSGTPGGTLAVKDTLFFQGETFNSTSGKRDWAHVGLRQLPSPNESKSFTLQFDPKGISSFDSRWYPQAGNVVAPLPPLPPSITRLTGPDSVNPGATGSLVAVASDPNGDQLTYKWFTILPNGEKVYNNPVGDANSTWSAPLPAGTYQVGFSVEDAYYITTICSNLPIVVPNLPPVVSITGKAGAQLPTEIKAGEGFDLESHATDPNGDAISWRWTVSGGDLTSSGTSAHFTAPSTPGDYTITAYASDGTNEVAATYTIHVIQPAPTPTPVPTPAPTYSDGTKLRMGLYATTTKTIVFEEFDLSGLPKISGSSTLKIGYYEPALTYSYIYEKDNTGKTIGFSWNYKTWGKYESPTAQSFVYTGNIQNGATSVLPNYYRVGFPGNSAVLLDANKVPLPVSRGRIWSDSYPAELICNVKMVKAILKETYPVRKYRLYFDDGSIGDSTTYTSGRVTGTITGTSPKGSVVMPVGTHFECGVIDNSNVDAGQAFTPVLPPVISKYF